MLIVLNVPHCLVYLCLYYPPNFANDTRMHEKCMAKYTQDMPCVTATDKNVTGICMDDLIQKYPTLTQIYPTAKFWTKACSNTSLNYTEDLMCMMYLMPYMNDSIEANCPKQGNPKLNTSEELDKCRKLLPSKDFCVELVVY